jgi:hypothetical protein
MKKKPKEFKPGEFIYHGGMVFEIDNLGKKRTRKDLGPNSGKFTHKYFKR